MVSCREPAVKDGTKWEIRGATHKIQQAQQTQARSGSLSISGGFCLAYMRGVTSLFWDAPLLIFYLLSVYFGIGP